ncbi:MAG: pimeloyl-ACP methyl ester carboxylesterase [Cognaticolwellia sp.]|jgi:pimeloyl-ACP methyl ester carboxylesterase
MKTLLLAFLLIFSMALNAQTIVSVELMQSYTSSQLTNGFFGLGFQNGADEYKVLYNTVDVDGNPTVASGAMYIPYGCDNFPMGVYQHGTIFNREDVPSRGSEQIGLALSGFGFATVAPDYLGMGDNPGVHPYLHAESQATAATDLLRAARDFIEDSLGLNHNDELFITGYSQGGHAAMGLHKYVQDNNLYTEFNLVASAPLSGPYNLSGIQTALPVDSSYSNPIYLPYLIESMQLVYGNVYLNTSDVYQAPYDSLIDQYKAGSFDISGVNIGLSNNVYDFMQPAFLNAFTADTIEPFTHPLRIALALNDNHDWTPQKPIRMVYCTADEQVYYQNALLAAATMMSNGATNVSAELGLAGGTHGTCFFPALLSTISYFNGLKTSCQTFAVTTQHVDYSEAIGIYPNPTQGFLQLDLTELPTSKSITCQIISMSGQIVSEQILAGEMYPQLNLETYPKGMYILRLANEDVRVQRKVTLF